MRSVVRIGKGRKPKDVSREQLVAMSIEPDLSLALGFPQDLGAEVLDDLLLLSIDHPFVDHAPAGV